MLSGHSTLLMCRQDKLCRMGPRLGVHTLWPLQETDGAGMVINPARMDLQDR